MYHPLQMVCGLVKHIKFTVMTVREQQEQSKMEPYAEASRFMKNAEDTLRKTRKEDGYYLDGKYVSSACGIAYKGVLKAMDAWLVINGKPTPTQRDKTKKHRDINMYRAEVTKLDGRMLARLNTVYNILHLAGYYDEEQKADIIRSGFAGAYEIIARIKPDVPEEELQQYLAEHTKKKSTLWGQLSSLLSF
ncbi:hypothetical protein FACS1894195_3020 [Bacteroidia bacterium]|nr:hypothetical protein FACS1894195_2990 [Bacteroidia bacterium]GHV61852.1 hypothetical protein FACS1894195_3020 [Bacteroidia bacterium]